MSRGRDAWGAFAVVACLFLAGCAAPTARFESALDQAEVFSTFTFAPDLATDARGEIIPDHPLFPESRAAPRVVQVHLGMEGADPVITSTPDGTLFATTYDYVQRSVDRGVTWEIVHEFRSAATGDRFEAYQAAATADAATGRLLVYHDNRDGCEVISMSDDRGVTWRESRSRTWPLSCEQPLIRTQSYPHLLTASPGPSSGGLAGTVYPNVVYACISLIAVGPRCAASLDGGDSFAPDVPIARADPECELLNTGAPAAHPDGSVIAPWGIVRAAYVFNQPDCTRAQKPTVSVSEDNGVTWTERVFSGDMLQYEAAPALTFSPEGTGYLAVRDGNGTIQLLRSRDKFVTWEGPFRVSIPDLALATFAAMTVGDEGHLAIAYAGTRSPQAGGAVPGNASGDSRWHLFVASSIDGASENPTFVTTQVTPREDPVHVGCIRNPVRLTQPQAARSGFCENLLNAFTMTHDGDGRFFVAFTDGCDPRNGCATDVAGGFQARDRQASVAVQDSGASLFAEKGVLESLGLSHPTPLETRIGQRGDGEPDRERGPPRTPQSRPLIAHRTGVAHP